MRQAVFVGVEQLEIRDRSLEPLSPADARAAVLGCGVCGSDIASYFHGHYVEPGQVMGHETVADVVEVGPDVSHLRPGSRVVARPLRACGECWYCRRGESHLCGSTTEGSLGYGADGAYADELIIRGEAAHRQLVPIDPGTPPEEAVWAEPLAVAVHALGRATLAAGDRALVVGAGPIGLALVASAVVGGASVQVVEPRAARREGALRLGAAGAFDPAEAPATPVDVVFDASGVPAAIDAAAARLLPGGRLVLVGLGDRAIAPPPPAVRVLGSFAFTPEEFARAARLIETGAVRLSAVISHTFGLEDTPRAIETAAKADDALKVVVRPAAA